MNGEPRPRATDAPSHTLSIPLYLILTILTCGIFNLYWNFRQMESCNAMLERYEFNFVLWLVLTVLTLGLYHLYYQYKMGAAINEIQYRLELPVSNGLPILSVFAAFVGVGVLADCIHQYELNRIDDEMGW